MIALLFSLDLVIAGLTFADEATALNHYEATVLPILEANCLTCHGAEKHKSEFRMDFRNRLLSGGELSDGIDLAKVEESFFVKALNYVDEEHEMPPKGKLPQSDIDAITEWLRAGAPMPEDQLVLEEVQRELAPHIVTEERKQYWAYREVVTPEIPVVATTGWNEHPVDALIAAKVEAAGLTPNPPASRESLIRRASYDLIGLPPSPAEVEAFVDHPASDAAAFAEVVDALLERPQYGEKWGRHWLDLVRYAESNGYERDSFKPHVWRYRDWVIKAFNDNMPYDEFITCQLAGDEIDANDPEKQIATGFYRLGLWDDEPADRLLQRYDILDGVADTTARSFSG